MKKMIFIAGLLLSMALTAFAEPSFKSEVAITPAQAEVVEMYTAPCAAKSPKIVKRGDRVIIIYDDGSVNIVDKDGKVTHVPA